LKAPQEDPLQVYPFINPWLETEISFQDNFQTVIGQTHRVTTIVLFPNQNQRPNQTTLSLLQISTILVVIALQNFVSLSINHCNSVVNSSYVVGNSGFPHIFDKSLY